MGTGCFLTVLHKNFLLPGIAIWGITCLSTASFWRACSIRCWTGVPEASLNPQLWWKFFAGEILVVGYPLWRESRAERGQNWAGWGPRSHRCCRWSWNLAYRKEARKQGLPVTERAARKRGQLKSNWSSPFRRCEPSLPFPSLFG